MSGYSLSADELDDLIYFTRAGDADELKNTITTIATSHTSTLERIISTAIDIDPEDPASSSGCSLLHWAAANNHVEILKYFLQTINATAASSEKLIKPRVGGLVNHQNSLGNTPLHWAALNGHMECVKLLVYAGADPSIQNAAGKDAVFEGERGEVNKNGPPKEEEEKQGAEEKTTKEVGVVEWLLENCEGLDQGFGGVDEGEASEPQQNSEKMDVDG
ncbi:putative ankyrin repeat protein [Phaeomoniella chlamydospora]|uniref:Putative ankyrin repeat protein n=1 Tax=Phaeomoniella chlamydospora TaxID=158046 RepID=A0A0G2EJQ6_PHACM|nr:putative ankyrin repeat protein [Phaeomoniella chlamydospora]